MDVADSSNTLHYDWKEDWAKTPDTPSVRANGRTHGVAEASDGSVYVFCQASPAVLVYDQSGKLTRSFADDFPEAHGLTLVNEGGAEYLWLTDQSSGRVAKLTLSGKTVQILDKPAHRAYQSANYAPTWAAADPS